MFTARTSVLLILLCLVCETFAQSANVIYSTGWNGEGSLIFGRFFKYHRVNRTAEYNVITIAGSFDPLPVYVGGVFINIDIGGQTYHWEHRGGCILNASLCPLPSNVPETTIQETFTPDFNFPDSVWAALNQRVGQIRIDVAWRAGGGSPQSQFQSANLLVGIEHTGPPRAGPPQGGNSSSNHSSSDPFASSASFAIGHSPAVSWTTGIITIVLIAASGIVAVLGRISEHLDAKQSSSHGTGGNSVDAISAVPVGAAAQAALAHKIAGTTVDTSHATNEKFGGGMGAIIASCDSGPPRMDPITLFLYFQFISTTGFLSLNYPPIYRAFTVNFAWANFMLPIGSFIRAGQRTRKCSLIEYPPGIAGYAAELGISPQEVFIVVYCVFLCACLILVGMSFLVLQLNVFLATSDEKKDKGLRWRILWQQMMSNNTLRLTHLGLGSLTVFVFWQWTLKCVPPAIAFASVTAFVLVVGPLTTVAFLIVRLASRPGGTLQLYTKESSYAQRWGTLYNSLNDSKVPFVVPLLTSVVLRSAIIAFGQKSGLAQLMALIILESIMCIGLFTYKPYYSPGYNRINYTIKGAGVISHLLLLPFIDQINLKPNAARALGIIILVIHSIVAFALFVLTVLKLGWGVIWYRKKHVAFEDK